MFKMYDWERVEWQSPTVYGYFHLRGIAKTVLSKSLKAARLPAMIIPLK